MSGDFIDLDALAQSYARCFGTADGVHVLRHLRALTVERCLGPDTNDAGLWFLEGQRALVKRIEFWVGSGRTGAPISTSDLSMESDL